MRAYLTVPAGASFARAGEADAIVLDAGRARSRVAAGPPVFVRVGYVDGPRIADDLDAAMPCRPHAVVTAVEHGRDVAHLGARLAVHEAECGWEDGSTRILALIASPAGILNASSLAGVSPRLLALGWDPLGLAQALAAEPLDDAAEWTPPLAQARVSTRLAAAAAGIEAVEAACPGSDEPGFRRHLAAARRDGFAALFVADPRQLAWLAAAAERAR